MVVKPRHSDSPLPCLNSERFFFGHVPHSIIRLASDLPGCSLATYMAIWDRSKLEGRGRPVTLPNAFARDPWGVDRHAKGRALRALEGAGLISVTRSIGHAPRITLLDPRAIEMVAPDTGPCAVAHGLLGPPPHTSHTRDGRSRASYGGQFCAQNLRVISG